MGEQRKFLLDFGMKAAGDASDGGVYVEGYASTYDPDRDGERVGGKSAFEEGFEEYLSNPILLFAHDMKQPIGTVVEHRFDHKGLWIKAYISAAVPHIVQLVKDGALRAFSIGGLMRVVKGVIDKIKLYEISVVSVPANPTALFEVASKAFHLDTSSTPGQEWGTGPGADTKSSYYGVSVTSDTGLDEYGEPVAGWGDAYVSAPDLAGLATILADLNRQIDEQLAALQGASNG